MPKDDFGHVQPGTVSAERAVPSEIQRPSYVGRRAPERYTGSDTYQPDEVEKIRVAGAIAAEALDALHDFIQPGVTTDEIDAFAHDFLVARKAYPSTLGYRGFPKSVCTSLNEVICHGIPDDSVVESGDILNVDITAYVDGFHGDTNRMYLIGDVAEDARLLVERTHEALMRGIKVAAVGRQVNVIGRAIESYAKRFGYGVVRDFTGHGVGAAFHTGLIIPHYDSAPEFSDVIQPGMVFTIEPMLTLGTHEWDMWRDGWTVVTQDKSLTAQFEHTIVVHESGPEILTASRRATHEGE